jgi:hypothetical protein
LGWSGLRMSLVERRQVSDHQGIAWLRMKSTSRRLCGLVRMSLPKLVEAWSC